MQSLLRLLSLIALTFSTFLTLFSQDTCPGCEIQIPEFFPIDTIYLSDAASGQVGVYYDNDVSFRLPVTTTPVASESIPAGLGINQFEITGVANLPPGLEWTPSQTFFDPSEMNDGCAKICGTPLIAGEYIAQVSIVATVFVIESETIFDVPITISPRQTQTEGFAMRNSTGCGSTTVTFQNNIPSNDNEGFSYQWNFGNGQMTDRENPLDIDYSEPGVYPVDYEVVIDTFGHFLTSVDVNEVECGDFLGRPDIQIVITDESGAEVFVSEVRDNVDLPVSFSLNFEIIEENYLLTILDADSGLGGDDDVCGVFNLTKLDTGNYPGVSDVASIGYSILHPVDTIRSTDTVFVFPIPAEPQIEVEGDLAFCIGDSVVLNASYEENVQWYQDTLALVGENQAALTVKESGNYYVIYRSEDGCDSVSDTVDVLVNALPEPLTFVNENNLLMVEDSTTIAEGSSLQWYLDQQAIPGADGATFCMNTSGDYALEITNAAGCSNRFKRTVEYDENFPNCVSSTNELPAFVSQFKAYPNPVYEVLNIEIDLEERTEIQITVYDLLGQAVKHLNHNFKQNSFQERIDVADLATGIYLLQVNFGTQVYTEKLVVK